MVIKLIMSLLSICDTRKGTLLELLDKIVKLGTKQAQADTVR